jgi:dihydrofolate reductase
MHTKALVHATVITSLDGQVTEPMRFAAPYFDADAAGAAADLLDGCDGVLFGRHTFEAFAGAWSTASGVFADRLNAMTKYVVSSTLEQTGWTNSHILRGDPILEVTSLRDRLPAGLMIYGLGRLSRTLLAHGLIDRIRFNVHPLLAGGGWVAADLPAQGMRLRNARARASGVVVLDYAVGA